MEQIFVLVKLKIIDFPDIYQMIQKHHTWEELHITAPADFSLFFIDSIVSTATPRHASSITVVRKPCSIECNAVEP